MNALLAWLDHRTGYRAFVQEALFEKVPGGARWRYVWGSTLVFAFVTQVVTGIFLWMSYSPSAQTAWESVYYIEFQMQGGSLLRGVHHYMAQAMVVLLALHLMQVVIDGAYKAPREINFWLGLVLMQIVLGLALTGYLLPWDQKGYWATQVATKIAGIVPLLGPSIQNLIVGGSEYGHHTLTRFFALHAGVLPGLLVLVLALHVALFRRHGITARQPIKKPDQCFWPDQVLKDAVACLAVLITVVVLATLWRAELGAPADPAESYAAARPEWYFLYLFQFLKFFHGESGEVVGAIVVPGALVGMLFLMPLIGRWRAGHWFNVAFLFAVLAGAAVLTGLAVDEDYRAKRIQGEKFAEVERALAAIDADLRQHKRHSAYYQKPDDEQLSLFLKHESEADRNADRTLLASYKSYRKSLEHIAAVDEADESAERARQLADGGIPPDGALNLLRNDPQTQGPKLFRKHCAACHDYVDERGNGIHVLRPLEYPVDEKGHVLADKPFVANGAPNLYGFATRTWIAGLLDPDRIGRVKHGKEHWEVTDAPYFGNTEHGTRGGGMVEFVRDNLSTLKPADKTVLENVVAALSAEAGLKSQRSADQQAEKDGVLAAGRKAIAETSWNEASACVDCHKFHDKGDLGDAPELTGYGSRQWLLDFVGNPAHKRFYGKKNDRMPAFAADAARPRNNLLTPREMELIVDWLRGQWYEPEE